MSAKVYPCGCKVTRGFLWIRSCGYHRSMLSQYTDRTTLASVMLEKHPLDFDGYEDQIIVVCVGLVAERNPGKDYPLQAQDASPEELRHAIQEQKFKLQQQYELWERRGLL